MNGQPPKNPMPMPTPTAVPWTPDMGVQQNQPAPVASPFPAPTQPQPMAAPQVPIHAQPYQTQPQQAPLAPATQPAVHIPVQHNQPAPTQPGLQSAHPLQAQPYNPPVQQPAINQQPVQQPQQFNQTHYGQTAQAPQYAQPAPPPPMMPPHMQAAQAPHLQARAHLMSEQRMPIQQESKSLLAKLLKRTPKPEMPSEVASGAAPSIVKAMPKSPVVSHAIINKNFVLGGIAGFIGAFALMTGINMFAAETPQRTQQVAAQAASSNVVPAPNNSSAASADGGTFIDNAIAADKP